MPKRLWKFIDHSGTFTSQTADRIKTLYFPLCNSSPIMSSLSPDLHGDLKSGFNSFLLEPAGRMSLVNSKASRNFWVYLNNKKIWSATGVSRDPFGLAEFDKFSLTAGLLWQKVTRQNKKIGLKAEITSFAPASGEPLEIMLVELTNISRRAVKFTPTAAIPLFCRSAANLHDHRHVTSLLQRIKKEKFGVIIKPTLLFDERGHEKNQTSFFVFAVGEDSRCPHLIYTTQEEFTGLGSDLEMPDAIFKDLPPRNKNTQGKEPMAGLKFPAITLKAKQTAGYIILLGIAGQSRDANSLLEKFNTRKKVEASLSQTKTYWQKKASEINIDTPNKDFNNWFKWVNIQPVLRKIFGCSFLPDFDYGKGGRGWRDLWQDCLALILQKAEEARPLLLNNFSGVRLDGSNATIIGSKPGEFIADRDNISRVWMDHGAWPLLTIQLYIHQSGDLKILLEECPYFESEYKGSALEHLLLENLIQFFNVGEHNNIRLENADWNDGLDMAAQNGESVAFSCLYAQNLNDLYRLIERLPEEGISLLKEIGLLLNDTLDYNDAQAKRALREAYLCSVKQKAGREKITLNKAELINSLKKKADWMYAHIQHNEWLKEGFFNGYYDNDQQRVEGNINGVMRMTLAGQALPIMSGIASNEQIKTLFKNAQKYLRDKKLGGFRLNSDFQKEKLNFGRAFSFVYGEKENGAVFSHMCVIFAYALYKQDFAREGFEVLDSLFKMSLNTNKSKIYPCLPEYFNAEGRGMYSYLTGSASWFAFTLLTQAFGIRGEFGDLLIEPKLTAKQFSRGRYTGLTTRFANKTIEVKFTNPLGKDYAEYAINEVRLNGTILARGIKQPRFIIPRNKLLTLPEKNFLEIIVG